SWSTTFVDSNRSKTGPNAPSDSGVTGLAVDTSGPQDVVYVGFQQSFPNAPKGSPLSPGTMVVAVSTNGGRAFGAPVNLNTFNNVMTTINGVQYPVLMNDFFGSPFLTVHDGTILAVSGSEVNPSVTVPGQTGVSNPLPNLIARSTDKGKTWTVQELTTPIYTGTGSQTGLGWTPVGGPHGEFLAVYAATPNTATTSGSANVVFTRSTDDGQTWSSPVVINDDNPALQYTSFYPQLGVAPNGRIDVIFEDNRNLVNYHFAVYYTYSTDGDLTWAHNTEVSDQPINFGFGISYNSDIRQPPGLASTNDYAYAGWADTRNANATNQNQDDYGAMAQFHSLPAAGSTTLDVLAAVFGGLAAGGLALIIFTG
ncbi:MAG: sialidase family protein, partial [Acidimicrobiales bacterium]